MEHGRFGANNAPPLLTGIAFTDQTGSGCYASGEVVGGVTVTAPGASSYYAVTCASSAYTLALDISESFLIPCLTSEFSKAERREDMFRNPT